MAKDKAFGLDFYQYNTRIKWMILITSVLISIGTIFYTNILVEQLKERERKQVEIYAKALEYTVDETDQFNILFITEEILIQNNFIPTILVDPADSILYYRNIKIDESWSAERKKRVLANELRSMKNSFEPIRMSYRTESGDYEEYGYVYYKNSFLLTQLIYYPYIQLSVIAIFGFISYLAFNYSKAAEQNRVWVGLAKETAHQLGTPLSSLMAWIELIKEDPDLKSKGITEELEKDVKKLQIVTERFSNIGSVPVLKPENILELVNNVVNYLRPRVSNKIKFEIGSLSDTIEVLVSTPLFEWVLENLCKNAVDAMGSEGIISIKILRGSDRMVFIDISDTGKG
ncbi:MAG TPA: histidine kinase, partial [Cyclobacteriaceae bacterium]|nr:histidine kinase [Cyclobacteriaceae bacterium]